MAIIMPYADDGGRRDFQLDEIVRYKSSEAHSSEILRWWAFLILRGRSQNEQDGISAIGKRGRDLCQKNYIYWSSEHTQGMLK